MKLFELWKKKKKPTVAPRQAKPRRTEDRSLMSVLNDMLKQNGQALAGRVHLVGLSEIKTRLGNRWDAHKNQVYTITENIISRHVTASDVYERHGDSEYLLVFSEMNEELSQAKLLKISKELHEHFLGSENLNDIRVTTAITHVDGSVHMEQVNLEEIAGKLAAKAESADQFAAYYQHKTKLRGEEDATNVEALRGHNANQDEKKDRSNLERQARLQQRFAGFGEKHLHYGFSPVWDMGNQVISTYQVLPIVDLGAGLSVKGYDEVVAESGEKQIHGLDLDVLEYGLDIFGECIQNNFKLFLAFPVHFETLTSLSHCKEYIDLINILPSALRQFLYFEIHGLPAGVPFGRLSDICTILRPHCRSIMVQVDYGDFNFKNFSEAGINVVILHHEMRSKPFKVKSEIVTRFASAAKRSGLTPWLSHVEDMQTAVVADKTGVGCICGGAVGGVEEVPAAIRRFTRKDFAQKFNA